MFYGSEGVALSVEQVSPVEYIFPKTGKSSLANLMGIAIPHTLVPGMPKGMHASLFAKTEYTQHSGTEQVIYHFPRDE